MQVYTLIKGFINDQKQRHAYLEKNIQHVTIVMPLITFNHANKVHKIIIIYIKDFLMMCWYQQSLFHYKNVCAVQHVARAPQNNDNIPHPYNAHISTFQFGIFTPPPLFG